ncbi:MAG: hypothetical protein MHM6MM_005050 [Cercozoa sp. M6MM]
MAKKFKRDQKRVDEALRQEIERRLVDEAPPRGSNQLTEELQARVDRDGGKAVQVKPEEASARVFKLATNFSELPLSPATQQGLKECKYIRMTDIQRSCLPHALRGRDVLGAAKTGSGKTLAFVVPVLERLWRVRWNKALGLGALIVTPTRELAQQVFQVLLDVGRLHNFSAACLTGGRSAEDEKARASGMNIVVATPGRLRMHLEQTPNFTLESLQVLVLDEADELLDSNFELDMGAILDALPRHGFGQMVSENALSDAQRQVLYRQTLLFSATQTKSVKRLTRMHLRKPEYIAVHQDATPKKLTQFYMTVEAHQKFDVLMSFLKTHQKQKIMIFTTTRKQCIWLHESFRRLQPGLPITHLHGKMPQAKRKAIYHHFDELKRGAIFTTNVAARGLDFHKVRWVLQFDAPEDVDTYVHRVGRAARHKSVGQSLMMLQPSEKALLQQLKKRGIAPTEVRPNEKQMQRRPTQPLFAAQVAEDSELRFLAQKAFVSYLRAIFTASNKSVFDVHAIDTAALAHAMGLPGEPVLKFNKEGHRKPSDQRVKNQPYLMQEILKEERRKAKLAKKEKKSKKDKKDKKKKKTKKTEESTLASEMMANTAAEKLLRRRNNTVLDPQREKYREKDEDDLDADDDFMKLTRVDHDLEDTTIAKTKLRKKYRDMGTHDIELGEERKVASDELASYAQRMQSKVAEHDVDDKLREHERVQEKRRRLKEKRRRQRDEHADDDGVTVFELGSASDNDDDDNVDDTGASSADDEPEDEPPRKRRRLKDMDTQDLEAMALGLLQ